MAKNYRGSVYMHDDNTLTIYDVDKELGGIFLNALEDSIRFAAQGEIDFEKIDKFSGMAMSFKEGLHKLDRIEKEKEQEEAEIEAGEGEAE